MSIIDEAFAAIGEFFGVESTVESRIGEGAGYATGYVAGYVLGGAARAQAMASFGASVGASVLDGGWNADGWLPVVNPEQEQQNQQAAGSGRPATQLTGVTTGEVVPGYVDELPSDSGQAATGDSATLEQQAGAAASSTPEQNKAVAAQSTSEQRQAAEAGGRAETAAFMDMLREQKYAGATAEGPSFDALPLQALLKLLELRGDARAMESLLMPGFPQDDLVFKNPRVSDAEPYRDWNADTPESPPVDDALVLDGGEIRGRAHPNPAPPFSDTLQKMYGGEPSGVESGEPVPIGAIVGDQPPAATTGEPSAAPTAPAPGAASPGFASGTQSAPPTGSFDGSGGGSRPYEPPAEQAPTEPRDPFASSFEAIGAPKGSWQQGALKGAGKALIGLHPLGRLYLFGAAAYDRLTGPDGLSPQSLGDFYLENVHPGYQLAKTAIAAEEAWSSNNDEAVAEIGTGLVVSLVSMLIIGRAIAPAGVPGEGALPERAVGERALSEGALPEGVAAEAGGEPNARSAAVSIEGPDFRGRVLTSVELADVEAYLAERGVALEVGSQRMPVDAIGAFDPTPGPDGRPAVLLGENPTEYHVMHELLHVEHWETLGPEGFAKESPFQKEHYVYNRLRSPHNWERLNAAERIHAAEYILKMLRSDRGSK